ncbi:MAG TPA: acyltransferase family protein, partial [Micromonospora sp.]
RRHRITGCCLGDDEELVVAVVGPVDPARVRRLVAATTGLPPRVVRVCPLPELPRLASGKVDYPALRAATRAARTRPAPTAPRRRDPDALCRLYAEVLDHPEVTADDSFVGLGGDSLNYVALSLRLERVLGRLPDDWHLRPIRDLCGMARPEPSRWRWLETSVALRAVAIVLIVGSHIPVFMVKGGAHLLLAVAGFNFARFHLTPADRRDRVRGIRATVGRVAVPSVLWVALLLPFTDDYGPANLALLHSVFGPAGGDGWHFWFIEALVYLLVVVGALVGLPAVDRLERRHPFGLPLAVAALGLITRYDLSGLTTPGQVPSAVVVFWLFALGWAAARATGVGQRTIVTLAAVATVPGFFGEPWRELFVVAGLTLLVWVPRLPSLTVVNRVAGVLAGSSLYIYLTHWQVFPPLRPHSGLLALAGSLLVGILASTVADRIAGRLRPWLRRLPGTGRAVPVGEPAARPAPVGEPAVRSGSDGPPPGPRETPHRPWPARLGSANL